MPFRVRSAFGKVRGLILLLPELILCAMFSHKFSLFFSFFRVVTYAVFMCVVYIYIFLSLLYGE